MTPHLASSTHIGVDYISSFGTGGNGRYTRELVRALSGISPRERFFCYTYVHHLFPFPRYRAPRENIEFGGAYFPSFPIAIFTKLGNAASRRLLRYRVKKDSLDIMHFTNPLFFVEDLPPSAKVATTIHDLAPLIDSSWVRSDTAGRFAAALPAIVRRSDALIAVSESTRRDLVRFFPDAAGKTSVVYEGVRGHAEEENAKIGESEKSRYILTVGEIQPRKNLEILLDAYAGLPEDVRRRYVLIHAGDARTPQEQERFLDEIRRRGLGDSVRVLGWVPDTELERWYRGAAVFAFPSLYEGFGLPVLEAMACGIPAVVSRSSSMPEVGGDAVLYFDPKNPDELRERLLLALGDPALRKSLREKGIARAKQFSWECTARETLEVYRRII